MKILITTDTYLPTINGVVTSIRNLTRALTQLGHEVRILTLAHDAADEGFQDNVYSLRSIKCAIYPDARVTVAFRDPILRAIEAWHPDIIHSQSEFSSFLCAKHFSKKLRIPLVHTYHTLYEDYTHYFCPNQVLGVLAVRRITRFLSRSVSLLCAPSIKVQRVLMGYGVQAPVAVLPTGIDLSKFYERISGNERRALRQSLALPADCRVLLALGRLAAEKNYDALLRDVTPVLRGRADTYLVLVGDGPYRAALETQVAARGLSDRVRFTGMVPTDKVPAYYQLGDIFVCASSSETQGLTYLEAMASGLPQVVFHDECLQGVVIDGKTGYQYETPEQCAAQLNLLLSNDDARCAFSQNAEEYALRFSMDAFGSRAATCYEGLIRSELLLRSPVLCK